MARDRGVAYRETLTGFKWIVDAALRGEKEGLAFVFGYEEALGYTVGTLVRDKDGIGAALLFAELARFLKRAGATLLDRLDELLVAHGLSHQVQWSVVLPGAEGRARIDAAMAQLRASPPARIGTSPVVRVLDAAAGEERVRGERAALRAAALGRAGLPVGGRRPAHRAPERHRAEDQVLPGAGRRRRGSAATSPRRARGSRRRARR